ncbi:teneurin-2 isoform X2 [Arapaima gigas]
MHRDSAFLTGVLHKTESLNFSLSGFLPGPPNHHSQSTLRPPLPPPHNHQTLSHHHSSANSLNRNTAGGRRNPAHAPTTAPGEGPTTPESVQLQDSWVLNSNVPLETR